MRLLADENIPAETIEALRKATHDVASTAEESPGASDETVLQRAIAENRIVLTFDKDFGELAFRRGLPASCGVILLRVQAKNASVLTALVARAFGDRDNWAGHWPVSQVNGITRAICWQ